MPTLVCVKCQVKMKNEFSGVHVVETFGRGSDQPYKLWRADLFKCPDCGIEVISGFGRSNYAEHYQEDFSQRLAQAEPKYWDKSCS